MLSPLEPPGCNSVEPLWWDWRSLYGDHINDVDSDKEKLFYFCILLHLSVSTASKPCISKIQHNPEALLFSNTAEGYSNVSLIYSDHFSCYPEMMRDISVSFGSTASSLLGMWRLSIQICRTWRDWQWMIIWALRGPANIPVLIEEQSCCCEIRYPWDLVIFLSVRGQSL